MEALLGTFFGLIQFLCWVMLAIAAWRGMRALESIETTLRKVAERQA